MIDNDDGMSNYSNDEYANYRERSNTWPSVQQVKIAGNGLEQHRHQQPYSPFSPNSQCSSRLSLICESNESLTTAGVGGLSTNDDGTLTQTNISPMVVNNAAVAVFQQGGNKRSSPSVPNYKAGHPSYVELITSAILSSPEKRMTLSEIYDWMVTNVSAFKDQRHLHSSAGWKNSVRHNLSLHSRFKRVKRNGMDKPSWWTVDLTEQSKDRKHRATKPSGGRTRSNTMAGGTICHPSPKSQSASTQNSSWSTSTSCRSSLNDSGLSLGGSIGSGVGPVAGNAGFQQITGSNNPFSQIGSMADPFVPQVTTLNQADLVNGLPLTMFNYKDESSGGYSPTSTSPPRLSHSLSSAPEDNDSAFASNTSLEAMEIGDLSSMNLHRFAQAITVTLRDQTAVCDGHTIKSEPSSSSTAPPSTAKPDIALQITGDMTGVTLKHANFIQQQLTIPSILSKFLRPSSAEDSRQMLRVHTNIGNVQDVAVPAPLPIRVVIHSDKQIQTDDLETALEYGLQIHSPSHYSNSLSPAAAAATVTTMGLAGSQQQYRSSPTGAQLQQQQQIQRRGRQSAGITTTMVSNSSPISSECNQMAAAISASMLPEDLASLTVEGDMDCNIMDVIRYEMCCNNKPDVGGRSAPGGGSGF